PVNPYELVDVLLVEGAHLVVDVGAADRGGEHLVRDLSLQHGLGRVAERGKDDLAGIDERAVEIEEDGRITHLVVHLLEIEAPGWGGGAGFVPRTPFEQTLE